MPQGSRPARVADQIREEVSRLLAREVKDPGVGFVTITRVQATADLQHARVYYTTMGDEASRRETARALQRAGAFLRRQVAGRLRLKRAPELEFVFDHSVEQQDRIERVLQELHEKGELTSGDDSSDDPQP